MSEMHTDLPKTITNNVTFFDIATGAYDSIDISVLVFVLVI